MVGFYLESTRRVPLLIPQKGRLRGCSRNIAFAEPPILPQSQMVFMRYPQIAGHPSYGRLSRLSMILAFSYEPSSSMLQLGRMYTRTAALNESRGFSQAWGKTNGGPVRYREISCVEIIKEVRILGREGADSFAYNADLGCRRRGDPAGVHAKDVGPNTCPCPGRGVELTKSYQLCTVCSSGR